MADRFNARVHAPRYARAAALFHYDEDAPYGRITRALKYDGNLAAGRFFASMLGRRMAASGLWDDVDMVVPVPLHWTRQFSRGYNQAEVIARALAAELGSECAPCLLRRVRRTSSQARLDMSRKEANVAGAFAVRPSVARRLGVGLSTRPLRVLLCDDVFTTGSTLAACANALLDYFGNRIIVSAATLGCVDV